MKINFSCYKPITFQNNNNNNKNNSINENEAYEKIEDNNSKENRITVNDLIQELVDDGMPRDEAIFFITTNFG